MARTYPPFDPELQSALAVLADELPPTLTADMLPALREAELLHPEVQSLAEVGLESWDVTITSYDGAEIELSVILPIGHTGPGPGFFHIHGGGMIFGDRMSQTWIAFDWLRQHNGVMVTVEYRLAPEHPDPTPVEDCYAALVWIGEHAAELGIDPDRLIIEGGSAGGGLAAGVTLLARDRRGPKLAGQMLQYPMLDDRDSTVSTAQIDGVGVWDRTSNVTGWTALLGDRKGTEDVSIYAAPARATDLSGLPPPSSTAAAARCSVMKTSPTPARSGLLADRQSSTYGRAVSTRSRRSHHKRDCRWRWLPHVTTGLRGFSDRPPRTAAPG